MNTGVEILLKRMETNPDDFNYQINIGGMSRWMRLVDHAIGDELLTQEEHDALKAGLKEVKRKRFTELVMKELAGVEDEASDEGKYLTSNTGMGGLTLTADPTASSGLAWANNTAVSSVADAQKYQTEMMKRQLAEYMKELRKQGK